MSVTLSMRSLAKGAGGIFAGETLGKAVFVKLVNETAAAPPSSVVYLDFEGVMVVTGSFLREAILGFRNYCTTASKAMRPVVANMAEEVRKEFLYFLTKEREAFVVCDLDRRGKPVRPDIVGLLEEVQAAALLRVGRLGEANAAELARGDKKTKPTAWNNRLAGLAAKGLLWEESRGRAKFYRPVVEV